MAKCIKPINKNGLMLPCGCCRNCRINETTDWSVRALFELHDYDTASFVTLTYDDEHIPKNGSLDKEQLQDYFDRFQHKVEYEKGIKLRFFSAGEYGDHTHRPHYHAIMYGLNPDPYDKNNDRKLIADSWKLCSPEMFAWNQHDYNKNAINFVTRETIQYVAGYVQKKLKSYNGELYKTLGIEPPFKIMSKGLGLNYAKENADILRENGYTYYNGNKVRIPRYFRDKLEIKKTFEEEEYDSQVLSVKYHLHNLELEANWNTTEIKFKQWLSCKGLPVARIDEPKYADIKERLFEHWYEMQRASVAEQAEREFLKVRAMHKGAI